MGIQLTFNSSSHYTPAVNMVVGYITAKIKCYSCICPTRVTKVGISNQVKCIPFKCLMYPLQLAWWLWWWSHNFGCHIVPPSPLICPHLCNPIHKPTHTQSLYPLLMGGERQWLHRDAIVGTVIFASASLHPLQDLSLEH